MPALLLLFVGSGCAALIYEIVWFQLLQLVIGSSAISLGVLLGTFMGGMCLGSLLLARLVGSGQHPLRVYAYLELGIGALGLLILFGLPVLSSAYTSLGTTGVVGLLLRGIAAAICLLPPTLLMGATLPAISRWVKSTPEGMSWLGFFYGGNIAGGVLGCLLAGFYLLRVYDMAIATYAAVALNLIVAGIALALARVTTYEPEPVVAKTRAARDDKTKATDDHSGAGSWAIYTAIGLSGFTALGSEVLWTRTLSLLFGGTAYTFSLILAVFLFGLGIGSSIGSALAGRVERPRLALGWCQMLLCAAMAWTSYMLTDSLPFWPINPSINRPARGSTFRSISSARSGRCFRARFSGAPASRSHWLRSPEDARIRRGSSAAVYAANTLGAIAGRRRREPAAHHLARDAAVAAGHDRRFGNCGAADARRRAGRVGHEEAAPCRLPPRFCSPPRWQAPYCSRGRFTGCRRSSSPTAATQRRASARLTSSTWVKAGTRRSLYPGSPTAF